MKKRLFGIITILGIGLSFCSADWFDIRDYYPLATLQQGTNFIYNDGVWSFGVKNPLILYSFCFIGDTRTSYLSYSLNDSSYIDSDFIYSSGGYKCFDFGTGLFLDSSISMSWKFKDASSSTSMCSNCAYFRPIVIDGVNSNTSYYQPVDGNFLLINLVNYGGISYFGPFISYSNVILNPKFKVNYGNTSYEYELEDNLEIHLKSPVIMSGSYNYIYDGSTGINLFYNNTSDFYSKDKLYLKSMYWYNKNIFTPICL